VAKGADITVQASLINPACSQTNDGSITINATGESPFTYLWSDGSTGDADAHLGAGVFSVKITDSYGCELDTTFDLVYADSLSLRVSPAFDSIDLGQSVTLTASANTTIKSYLWTPALYLSCSDCADPTAAPTEDIVYKVHVTDAGGCSADDSVTILVHNDLQLYIPNSFTPNSDGTNDFFEIFGSKNAIRYVSIAIYDRWGEKVYQSNDIDFKWDGTYKGAVLAPGIYVYTLDISFVGQTNARTKKGSITLIR
jgi:gliding motility-associated-like protein